MRYDYLLYRLLLVFMLYMFAICRPPTIGGVWAWSSVRQLDKCQILSTKSIALSFLLVFYWYFVPGQCLFLFQKQWSMNVSQLDNFVNVSSSQASQSASLLL